MGWLTAGLTIIGYALGGPLGAFVGALVGSAIEASQVDSPPSIDEIRAMGASEGDGMQYCIGSLAPVPGELVWRGPLLKKDSESVGTRYRMPLVISFGRTFTGLPIEKFIAIFANGSQFYYNYDEFNLTSTSIAATLTEISAFDPGTGTTTVVQRYLDLSGADFTAIGVNRPTTVSGFANAGNNGSFWCISATATTCRIKDHTNALHLFVTEAAGASVTVFQPEFVAASPSVLAGVTIEFGFGTVDQEPPIAMQAYEGDANLSNMSGVIWAAFGGIASSTDGFKFDDFGLAVPRFTALVRERKDTDLPTVLKDIAVWSGLDECEVNTVNAVGVFYGFAMRGPRSLRDTLIPFLLHYNLITQEKDLQFCILHRLAAVEIDVDEDVLGATDDPDPVPAMPIKVDREDPKRLPAEVDYAYLDRDKKGQPSSQPYRRPSMPLSNVTPINVPIVADKDQAKKAAKRFVMAAQVGSERHGTALPPSMMDTYESDRLYTTSNGRERITLLTRVARGSNYLLEMEGRRDDPEMFANEVGTGGPFAGPGGGGGGGPEPVSADPLAIALDIPPLADADVATPLVYIGAVRESGPGSWAASEVHESPSGGGGYVELMEAPTEAVAGFTVGALPSGPVGYWDLGAALTVDFAGQPAPASVSDETLLSGASNWFYAGGEVFAAATVTLVSGSVYTLSRRLRGLMDTAERVATHAATERVVQIRPFAPLGRREYLVGDVGTAREWDACLIGDSPDGVQPAALTLNGSTVRPFSGAQAAGTRHLPATNDWTVTWKEATRRPLWPTFTGSTFDDVEATETYNVEVWTSGFGSLVRTITHTATGAGSVITTTTPANPQLVYDEADQVTDFGSAQTTLRLRIYQVGAAGLRSKKYEVTI